MSCIIKIEKDGVVDEYSGRYLGIVTEGQLALLRKNYKLRNRFFTYHGNSFDAFKASIARGDNLRYAFAVKGPKRAILVTIRADKNITLSANSVEFNSWDHNDTIIVRRGKNA